MIQDAVMDADLTVVSLLAHGHDWITVTKWWSMALTNGESDGWLVSQWTNTMVSN